MPKNTFNGATMSYANVSTYYPINPKNPDFDHFVFQQVLANPNNADNVYGLCAYAVFTAVSGLQPVFVALGAQNKSGQPYKAPAGVQFANMKLDQSGLSTLYPPVNNGPDMILMPVSAYEGTEYVVYTASTPGSIHAGGSVTLNPSPPYNG